MPFMHLVARDPESVHFLSGDYKCKSCLWLTLLSLVLYVCPEQDELNRVTRFAAAQLCRN